MPVSSPDRADLAACKRALRHGSRTFLAASWLLPARVRDAACALYAFCRDADDAIDLGDDPAAAHRALLHRIAGIYGGRPGPSPVDRAFARVVEEFAIPRALPEALLEGFAWDASGRRYESESDLLAYASRVAGSVGVMMALLMGRRAPAVLGRAAELGMAMQLTNIARDVGEDAANGRLYLPGDWLRAAGVDPDAWLATPRFNPAIGAVVERLLAAADRLYLRADVGIGQLPRRCAPGIAAAGALYRAIGSEVRRRGLDSVSGRAVVPASRKLALLAQVAVRSPAAALGGDMPAEARYLVDAVAAVRYTLPVRRSIFQRLDDRIAMTITLFDRLERLDRRDASA
jgi:phytoene synthase